MKKTFAYTRRGKRLTIPPRMVAGAPQTSDPVWVQPTKAAMRIAEAYAKLRPTLPPSRQAMVETGLKQMRRIMEGKYVDGRLVCNWFARHLGEAANAEVQGKTTATSKAMGAVAGWGGEPLYKQACRAVERHDRDFG